MFKVVRLLTLLMLAAMLLMLKTSSNEAFTVSVVRAITLTASDVEDAKSALKFNGNIDPSQGSVVDNGDGTVTVSDTTDV